MKKYKYNWLKVSKIIILYTKEYVKKDTNIVLNFNTNPYKTF